jgi:hypothetical protein
MSIESTVESLGADADNAAARAARIKEIATQQLPKGPPKLDPLTDVALTALAITSGVPVQTVKDVVFSVYYQGYADCAKSMQNIIEQVRAEGLGK